ncbi:MAG TPA: hypothetical protein PLZ86_00860 [bacterium]|nr:hypothetical protein [bacterium]
MKKNEPAERSRKSKAKGIKYAVGILVSLAVIAAAVVLLRFFGKDLLQWRYDASQPTSQKFAKIARWIPAGAEFEVAVDVQKALSKAGLREKLASLSQGQDGVAADLLSALLERQSSVGMLMMVGMLGEPGSKPAVAVVAQGSFDEKNFIPAIRAALVAGRSGISYEKIGGRKLYAESDARDPFGFMILDRMHIAVGTRASLSALFSGPPSDAPRTLEVPDAVLFGRFSFGPRLLALLPNDLSPVARIDFASVDGTKVSAKIEGKDLKAASDIRMFLEGIRALLLIQEEGNAALESVLKGVSIEGRDGSVTIGCDVLPLLEMWSTDSEATSGGDAG